MTVGIKFAGGHLNLSDGLTFTYGIFYVKVIRMSVLILYYYNIIYVKLTWYVW